MRYWTLNNLPLFLLAGPLLAILFYTGYLALLKLASLVPQGRLQSGRKLAISDTQIFRHVLPRFALPQLVLAVMAATSFHVQIINRISSGYPVWYILLAIAMHNTSSTINTQKSNNSTKRVSDAAGSVGSRSLLVKSQHLQWIVRGMVAFAIVQGGLYASFLPPA
jgi:phosphatidylinositol glycan class V